MMSPWSLAIFALIIAAWITFRLWVRDRQAKRRSGRFGNRSSAVQTSKRLGRAQLAERLGLSVEELRRFKPSYRTARIPKRGRGYRQLMIPDPETKMMQRRLLRRLLGRLQSHAAACGYETGKSIVDNATPHLHSSVLVRLDLVNFFPSTRSSRIEAFFERLGWDRSTAKLLTGWVCTEGGLPQGAPTSPRLSNLVNRLLDHQLNQAAEEMGARYTRYADDLSFSFPFQQTQAHPRPDEVGQLIQIVTRIVRRHGYQVHRTRKRFVRRAHQQQAVTGLVVNRRVQLPRHTRRWLRAVQHHLDTGRLASLTPAQLQGWQALQQMVDGSRTKAQPRQSVAPGEPHSPSTPAPSFVPSTEVALDGGRFQEAVELIHRSAFRSEDRQTFIQGLLGQTVSFEGAIQENLPTFDSSAHGTPYEGGRTLVLQLSNHGPLVEVRLPRSDNEQASRWMFGEERQLVGTVVEWNSTYDRPRIVSRLRPSSPGH